MSDSNSMSSQDAMIAIPIRKDQICDFVLSLLGQPQSIDREIAGAFIIKYEWIKGLLYSLNQRITQQNESTLVSFKCMIAYDNHEKRTINSFLEFEHFEETKLVQTREIRIDFSFLVKFPRKDLPEKQTINLFISTDGLKTKNRNESFSRIVNTNIGIIRYQISSTERTWADDIDQIFDRNIAEVLKGKSFWKIVVNGFILLGMYIGSMCSLFSTLIFHDMSVSKQKQEIVNSVINSNLVTMEDKINVLYSINLAGIDSKNYNLFSVAISFILSFVVIIIGTILINSKKQSFILLTKQDDKKYAMRHKSKIIRIILWAIGFVVSIFGGIASNYIFNFLKG